MTPTLIYKDNENLIELDELKNSANDTFVNDATVAVTIKNAAGTTVSGETFPKTMTYVASSDGKYQAALSDLMVLVPGQHYTAFITAISGALNASWEIPLRAATRTS